jgi:hypothetical protein
LGPWRGLARVLRRAAHLRLRRPGEVLRLAKKEVASGRAKSLSSFVSEAVDEKLRRDELAAILDAMDLEHGRPNKAQAAWAKRVLKRSS